MSLIKNLLGKEVEAVISGNTNFAGILADTGPDIVVLFDGQRFLYIPLLHLHTIKERDLPDITETLPGEIPLQIESESISYRKILSNAKGKFLEIFVTGNRSIHGYITSVLNDYIVFYSPVYKTLFISMQHLKWFIPYSSQLTPYTLKNTELPVAPTQVPLVRSFEDQLKRYEGKLVVFDLGDNPSKVGLLKDVSSNIIELINAGGETVYWKISHLKTVYFP
jgi:hypothetical protein